MNDRP